MQILKNYLNFEILIYLYYYKIYLKFILENIGV